MADGSRKDPGNRDDQDWGKYLGYGLQMLVGVLLGLFGGRWVDDKLHTDPWGLLIGVTLGLASGMYLLIKDAIRMNKD
jgi:F0F1-type ATP synthase assembly protein I